MRQSRIDFTRTDLSSPAATTSEKPATKADDWLVPLDVGSGDKGRHSGHSENQPADPVSPASLQSVQDIQAAEASAMETEAEPAPLPSAPSAAEAHDVAAPKPALVSEKTSRQVAAAFGELSDAFAARSKKSLDEMAEEMLRPMLQDWLDNNLPTLVERLVREEIERVARGA
jgi:cell pole-organizing protein PopZ